MDESELIEFMLGQLEVMPMGTVEGMPYVLKQASRLGGGEVWLQATDLDWQGEEDRFMDWVDDLMEAHPPPAETRLLWFETPNSLNPAMTSVSAYPRLGTYEEEYGLDEARIWPMDEDGTTPALGMHPLTTLNEAWTLAGWWPNRNRAVRVGVELTAKCMMFLLLRHGLPQTDLLKRVPIRTGVPVVMGHVSGGVEPIGKLKKPEGWKRLPR